MDWNKTKTIFIIVFSILNLFLYSLYINRYTEAQNVQVMWETTIEESLELDNIKIVQIPVYGEESSYIYAEIAEFEESQLSKLDNQLFNVIDETHLYARFKNPVPLGNAKDDKAYDFKEFLSKNVLDGEEFILWTVDKEERQAIFFQKVKDNPIFFNQNGMLVVYWNEEDEITHYDQRMFSDFDSYNKKKDLLSPKQAINTLYSRGYLKPDSTVKEVSLGYSTSTLIQPTKTQVFAPTWRIHVQLKDGEVEDYFINAIEGKIIEFQSELNEEESEEDND